MTGQTRRADFGAETRNQTETAGREGMSQRQVAAALGLRKSTVADIESRALTKVRENLVSAGFTVEDLGRLG